MAGSGAQQRVAARLGPAAALGLLVPPGAGAVPAVRLADPAWTAAVLEQRAPRRRTASPRVLATTWWYSASTVLLAPPLAGLATGTPLSGRLADLTFVVLPGPAPVAALADGPGAGDLAADLRDSLTAVVAAVAAAGRMRERPLWAIATDSIANQLLAFGRALGDPDAATAQAVRLAAAIGGPLPVPRFEDVGGARFTRRASCCFADRLPGGALCTSCPRRPPVERRALLERAARGW